MRRTAPKRSMSEPVSKLANAAASGSISRRGVLRGLAGLAAAPIGIAHAQPAGMQYFRIAAGPVQSRYFQLGTALAETISAPAGLRTCGRDRVCGVPGLIAIATTTNGPGDNFRLIAGRQIEAGLLPSRLIAAPQAARTAAQTNGNDALCILAPLYYELVHLVVMADSPVLRIADLRGRRVCLGDDSSGGPHLPQQVLAAAGLQSRHVKASQRPLAEAAESLVDGEIDAFFCVEGQPSPTIRELSSRADIRLVPIGPEYGLSANLPIATDAMISGDAYRGVGRTPTVGFLAVWAGHVSLDTALVYALTRAVWHSDNRLLRETIAAASASALVQKATSLELPFHPGSPRFYRDFGMPS